MQLRAKQSRGLHTTVGDLLAALYEAAAEMTTDPEECNALVREALRDFARSHRELSMPTPKAA